MQYHKNKFDKIYLKIVVGSSLESLLYSYYNKCKIIFTRNLQPEEHDVLDNFGLGYDKKAIWNKYSFQLSLGGYIPFENKIKHIRYEDINTIKIISHEENVYTINFENLYVFDDYNFLDLPLVKTSTSKNCRIIDEFEYKSKFLDMENIQQDSDFLNQIMFDSKYKKIKVISYCPKLEIDNFPEHLVKIKSEKVIKVPKLELDHISRKIIDLGQNIYDNFDNVKFMYEDPKLIYEFYNRRTKIDYMKYLKIKMGL